MSITFRKRLKVLPGIYLNIGRTGVSTTIGPRGASISISKSGVYINSGIPGTGISNRQKLFGADLKTPINLSNNDKIPLPNDREENIQGYEGLTTSEGLKHLKDHLEDSKNERRILLNEIIQTKKAIIPLEGKLAQKKNEFIDSFEKEKIALATRISESSDAILELKHRLYKKQNGSLSKLFAKQETIDNIKAEIENQSDYLDNLLKQKEESEKPFNVELSSIDELKQDNFFINLIRLKEEIAQVNNEVQEFALYLSNLQSDYENAKADINIQSEAELSDQYEKVADAFNALRNSNKIWDITSEAQSNDIKSAVKSTVTRQEVQFSLKDIDFIKCSEPAFFLENANGSHFYIYPAFVLLMDKNENFNLLDLKNLEFKFNRRRFIEEKNSIPSDSKIIDNIWAKVNKDGSPDLRFRGNYQTPVVNYGVLNFNIKEELNEVYNISNCEASELFAEEFLTYLALLKNDIGVAGNTVTKQYFDIVKEFGDKFISFIIRIQNDKKFIDKIYKIQSVKEQPFNNSTELIRFMFDRDLIICFGLIADISNLHSKEAFALLYIVAKMNGLDVNGYTAISVLYGENMLKAYVGMCKVINEEIQQPNNDLIILKFSLLLSAYDADLQKEYLANLYRFASIVVKADGKVTEEEQEALKKILNISEQNSKLQLDFEHNQLVERKASDTPPSIPALNKALVELDSLIGLSAVKAEVKSLINFIKIQKAREVTGLKSSSLSYHLVFTGNPGTGKTTVARIISEIYKNLGVLLEGQLIETDRSGLVAEYVGQTAIKVNKVVESALNGTLFIDEAYSLVGANRDDFGKEAVATLIKRMEDNREKLVVIIAGYTNEMREFIDTNPGFKSRFNRYIEFADYTPDELLSIYKLSCSKLDYTLTKEAEGKLFNLIVHAVDKKDNSFGNGRFVRNILEKTLEKQANRIANISSLTTEILTTITLEDIPEYSF